MNLLTPRNARLICGVVAALCTSGAAAQTRVWDFQAFLDDARIGYHRFTLTDQGGVRELKSETRFEVKILFITAYRYTHNAVERWRGDCLDSLQASTDDNGEKLMVDAVTAGDRLTVNTGKSRADFAGCVMSFAYWNPQMLRQTLLLNAQTGALEPARIVDMGNETIAVRGAPVAAKRYRITGPKNPIDLWYSPSDEWLALESTLAGGRRLRYALK